MIHAKILTVLLSLSLTCLPGCRWLFPKPSPEKSGGVKINSGIWSALAPEDGKPVGIILPSAGSRTKLVFENNQGRKMIYESPNIKVRPADLTELQELASQETTSAFSGEEFSDFNWDGTVHQKWLNDFGLSQVDWRTYVERRLPGEYPLYLRCVSGIGYTDDDKEKVVGRCIRTAYPRSR